MTTLSSTVGVQNPYPGLRTYEIHEWENFFGRNRQIDELLVRLRDHRFVAVVGLSGSGKSSLVRAGLIHRLEVGHLISAGSRWRIALFRPGSRPLEALARALDKTLGPMPGRTEELGRSTQALLHATRSGRSKEENLLLVVDQFEEIFRYQRESELGPLEAARFVELLLAAEQDLSPDYRVYVVLTMRSDYLGDSAQFDGLPEALNRCLYLVPKMTREQMREAIAGPAALTDTEIDPDVVQRLLVESAEGHDALPLVQHLLARLWEKREPLPDGGWRITSAHYENLGGPREALNQQANAVLEDLKHTDGVLLDLQPEKREDLVARIFQQLTDIREGRDQRRPAPLSKLADLTGGTLRDVTVVVEHFFRAGFLTSPDRGRTEDWEVDITHESLLRQWPKLQQWAKEEAADAEEYREFAKRAARLTDPGRPNYLTGTDLDLALRWLEKRRTNAWAERYHGEGQMLLPSTVAFIEQSRAAREEDKRLAVQQLISTSRTKIDSGDFKTAASLLTSAVVLAQQQWGDNHPDTLSAMNALATLLYAHVGDLEGAWHLQEQVLEARRKILGEEHPDTLAAMSNLAKTLQSLGNITDARTLQDKVLEIRRRVLGEEHPDTLAAMSNLAKTLQSLGNITDAQTLGEKVNTVGTRESMFRDQLLDWVTERVETARRVIDGLGAQGGFAERLAYVTKDLGAHSLHETSAPTISVAPNGSISRAIRSAAPGARIVVKGPATFRESLIIDKPLEIVGDGDVTLIGVGGPAITSTGAAVRIASLNISAEGSNGVVISGGYCSLDQLEITKTRYSGVLIRDAAEASIISCSLHHAEHCGVHAQLGSKCTVVASSVRENGVGGLFFSQGAEGLAESNLIEHNGINGIYIAAGANPHIFRNQIRHHPCAGVLVYQHNEWRDYGPGRGMIEDNEITNGRQFGIQIQDRADPCVRRNLIKANEWGGIWTRERGRGTIYKNQIAENLGSGIKNEGGRPLIGPNDFFGNRGQAIEDQGGAMQVNGAACETLKKVLWVDDIPANNDELIDTYRPLGISFDLALNTKQALHYLTLGEYALIISDIGRGADWEAGIDMIPEIRKRFPAAPPIVIYAHPKAVEAHTERAKALGAGLVTASSRELERWLEKILGQRER